MQNSSERILADLAQNSFLSPWCFPSPYRKSGDAKTGKGDGREFCDLLVVFGDDIIIFSDKYIDLCKNKEIQISWKRWYTKAVERSIKQLVGANSWLLRKSPELFQDKQCTQKIKNLELSENSKIHLVAVANGSRDSCRDYFEGGSGSLVIERDLADEMCSVCSIYTDSPFSIKYGGGKGEWVHVFDDVSIRLVMKELDTAKDFIAYLEERKRFLSGNHSVFVTGEENMLAMYLHNGRPCDGHMGLPPGCTGYAIDEGEWHRFISNLDYIAGNHASQISYYWDEIIDLIAQTGFARCESDVDSELVYRHMAALSRFERRVAASLLADAISKTEGKAILRRPWFSGNRTAFLFIVFPRHEDFDSDFESHRQKRQIHLDSYSLIFLAVYRSAVDRVVGIATESGVEGDRSYDFAFIEKPHWEEAELSGVMQMRKQLGYLLDKNITSTNLITREYPSAEAGEAALEMRRVDSQCACGSGRAFGDCCGFME